MMNNYHSHTYLCRHAGGKAIDYIKEALKLGFKKYGISEHAPMPNLEALGSVRLLDSEYNKYLHDLEEAINYGKDKIKIYKELEVEYFNFYHERYDFSLKKWII